jgi:hypothetical protein
LPAAGLPRAITSVRISHLCALHVRSPLAGGRGNPFALLAARIALRSRKRALELLGTEVLSIWRRGAIRPDRPGLLARSPLLHIAPRPRLLPREGLGTIPRSRPGFSYLLPASRPLPPFPSRALLAALIELRAWSDVPHTITGSPHIARFRHEVLPRFSIPSRSPRAFPARVERASFIDLWRRGHVSHSRIAPLGLLRSTAIKVLPCFSLPSRTPPAIPG